MGAAYFLVSKAKKRCTGLCNLWILFSSVAFLSVSVRFTLFEVTANVNYVLRCFLGEKKLITAKAASSTEFVSQKLVHVVVPVSF